MSDTADTINRVLAEEYWTSRTTTGALVYPLRSDSRGCKPPGVCLVIREDRKYPNVTVAKICTRGGRSVTEEKSRHGKIDGVIRFARETLRKWGVPMKPEEDRVAERSRVEA